MNFQVKNFLLAGTLLLLTACGRFDAMPVETPEDIVSIPENQANAPETMDASDPAENAPMASEGGYEQYIGMSYQSLPENLSLGFWMHIQDSEGYGLMLVNDGADKMLWLTKSTEPDSNGNSDSLVMDVLGLSNLGTGLTLIPDACFLNDAPDSEILVVHAEGVIQYAWRVDTALGKFQSIPINGIHCDSDKATNLD